VPALVIPNKAKPLNIPVFQSRIPTSEELVVLDKPLLDATIEVGNLLKDCHAKWALAGDIGEILNGVNVQPDHLTILTDAVGCEEIGKKLERFQVEASRPVETQIKRNAEIGPEPLPISIKSYASQFNLNGQRLNVHGDLRIKVGDWDWGDPLEYEPEYVYVVGTKVPVIPLELKTQLYMGLGWIDRVRKINEAMTRRHHKIG
jgi:hypothetical protein